MSSTPAHSAASTPTVSDGPSNPTSNLRSDLDVLVIGAGQAGLSLAWHLNRRSARYLVVDGAPAVGHSWRTRWDSLRLFTPAQYNGLPGTPFPGRVDTHPTKDQVADYLASYAQAHAIPVLTGTRVNRLTLLSGSFTAHTDQGPISAHQVVLATGAFHRPLTPTIDGVLDPGVPQIHSSSYRSPSHVPGGRVLVVGAGNSGLQIADELRAHTGQGERDVVVAAGTHPPVLPQRFAGRDLFWWLVKLRMMTKPADSRLARRVRARGDLVIGTDRKRLVRDGIDFRPRLVSADGRTMRFADGTSSEVDAVVWATGFTPDFTWIEADVTTERGDIRHHEGRTPLAGLWVLGQPWQCTRGSSLLGFVQHDAVHVAAQLNIPSRDGQRRPPPPRTPGPRHGLPTHQGCH
jgi:putative flavoprotein involved in K+ transport